MQRLTLFQNEFGYRLLETDSARCVLTMLMAVNCPGRSCQYFLCRLQVPCLRLLPGHPSFSHLQFSISRKDAGGNRLPSTSEVKSGTSDQVFMNLGLTSLCLTSLGASPPNSHNSVTPQWHSHCPRGHADNYGESGMALALG